MFDKTFLGTFQCFKSKKFSMMFKISSVTSNYFINSASVAVFIHLVFDDPSLPYPTPFFFFICLVPSSSCCLLGDTTSAYFSWIYFHYLLNWFVSILNLYRIVLKNSCFIAYSLNYVVLSILNIYATIFKSFWVDFVSN